MAFFGWLDASESERRRMLEAIDLFRESSTLDELGLGAIRDAFANRLFPGTSTIQTRLRYFLFVPWTLQELRNRRVRRSSGAVELRKVEAELVESLRAGLGSSAAGMGLVGIERGAKTIRLPVSIYWNGTRTWDIRRLDGSIDQCLQTLNTQSQRRVTPDGDEIVERHVDWWDPNLPSPPDDWLELTDFKLTPDESSYLRSRMVQSNPESMLAHLANQNRRVERVGRVWELADVKTRALPPKLLRDVGHAEAFSTLMHGSMLLYNLILSRLASDEELANFYTEAIASWRQTLQQREGLIGTWDMSEFWDLVLELNPRVGHWTQSFVESWCRLTRDGVLVESSREALELVEKRERQTKKSQARVDNRRALDMWNGNAGAEPLSFRWLNARRLLDDLMSTGGGPRA